MYGTHIKFRKRRSLRQYVIDDDGSLSCFTLLLLGVMAALLHQHLRVGLNIPGHHGLEWLTLLLFGRMQSRHRWAGLIIAAGALSSCMVQAITMPFMHMPTTAMFYLLNGLCVDILFRAVPADCPVLNRGVIIGGFSYIIKPVVLMPIAIIFDAEFGSFEKFGYLVPIMTHFVFGSIGAVTGISLAGLIMSVSRKQKP